MSISTWKQTALASLAAVTIVAAAIGVAAAQQPPTASPSPTIPGPGAPGGPGKPSADRQAHHEQFINALAAKLNVTPDRLKQAMEDVRKELGVPDRGGMPGPGRMGGGLDAAAKAIGITVEQLRQELPGKTLAQVAQAHNVNPTTVATSLKTEVNARIDQAAASGRIPGDQVAQAKQRAADQIDQMMTRQVPAGGFPQRRPQS